MHIYFHRLEKKQKMYRLLPLFSSKHCVSNRVQYLTVPEIKCNVYVLPQKMLPNYINLRRMSPLRNNIDLTFC